MKENIAIDALEATRNLRGKLWVRNLFDEDQREGGLVIRSAKLVTRMANPDDLEEEVRRQGYHLALIGSQYVMLCEERGRMQFIC